MRDERCCKFQQKANINRLKANLPIFDKPQKQQESMYLHKFCIPAARNRKVMRPMLKRIFLLLLIIIPFTIAAQEPAGGGEKQSSTPTTKAQRKSAKRKWKEQRLKKMEEKKKIKNHHKRIQTKEVRKKMRRDARKAKRVNEHKREFFLKRWFRR